MPENFRHFHDFPVDGDMIPTEGSLKCRKFSVDGDMVQTGELLKCRKFSGTFSGR